MAELKKLVVCLSKELPDSINRSPDKMYLAYDKLKLYSGSSMIDENFVIASTVPDNPVPGMIYIMNTDGTVHRQVDHRDNIVAELEDSSQLELLREAGTIFYVNSNGRYIDPQKRSLTLPFNDGSYELNISMRNNQVFNNNTIVKFDEKHQIFSVYGPDDDEFVDFSRGLKGGKTSTVNMFVDKGRIFANIKVSAALDNMLKIASDGLYAKVTDKVDSATFNQWKADIDDFKKYAHDILDNIDAEITSLEKLVSPEEIEEKMMSELRVKYPEIDTALANYEEYVNNLDRIENEVMRYASDTIISARDNLDKEMKENSTWNDLDDSTDTYSHEIDYYDKSEKYLYPKYTTKQIQLIVTAAAMAYFEN